MRPWMQPILPSLLSPSSSAHKPSLLLLITAVTAAFLATSAQSAQAQAGATVPTPPPGAHEVTLEYYLPADGDYDPAIPTPKQVLGFEVGEWHVRHDLLVRYMEAVAEASDRVQLEVIGHTHEARPLMHLTISSPANLARLEEIRQQHLAISQGKPPSPTKKAPNKRASNERNREQKAAEPTAANLDLETQPVVVNMGYSVHGNEPSGSNASLLLAYYLAAGRDDFTRDLLNNAVILLDPSLNPDGLSRFAQWANMHRGQVPVADRSHREHREAWPSGRTNHYWFDLNRDWLLAQHPESQARLSRFHHWRPNVLTDFHEMGTSATYFFQPGVESRKNPLTPKRNVELTQDFAEEHARALDAIGSIYYSQEDFDDFYYGKGSTYPDVHGSVGILFEQASSRGHAQDSPNVTGGVLTFPFTVRNQFTTSLSTLRAALAKRTELLGYQRQFFDEAMAEGGDDARQAFIFGDSADRERVLHLVELLRRHDIEVRHLERATEIDGQAYDPGSAFVVPLAQRQSRLVRALFETQTEFEDSTFYDVSTWTLPLAFGLTASTFDGVDGSSLLGAEVAQVDWPEGTYPQQSGAVAYAFEWASYHAPRVLTRLFEAEVKSRVATKPFRAAIGSNRGAGSAASSSRGFPRGTILIPTGIQDLAPEELHALVMKLAREEGVDMYSLTSGLTPDGVDLGSPSSRVLERPRVALLVGNRTNSYEAGEAWHLLDHRFGVPTLLLDHEHFSAPVLDDLTHLILVNGATAGWEKEAINTVRSWVRRGGILIAQGQSAVWATEHLTSSEGKEEAKAANEEILDVSHPERLPYANFSQDMALQLVSGTIFQIDLDLTHPLAYGYVREQLPVFRSRRLILDPEDDPYAKVGLYSDSPRLSGYVSPENIELLRGSPAVLANRMGRGTVVRLADNPNFRAFWYGTTKLFLNGIFFGGILDHTTRPGDEADEALGAHH